MVPVQTEVTLGSSKLCKLFLKFCQELNTKMCLLQDSVTHCQQWKLMKQPKIKIYTFWPRT